MSETFFYPQRMGRIILQGMEEIIGRNGVHAVLNLAALSEYIENYPPAVSDRTLPFKLVSDLHVALEQAYGPRGGRGLALRIGRATFAYGLREYGSQLGLTEMAFRLLPLPTKLRVGPNPLPSFSTVTPIRWCVWRKPIRTFCGTSNAVHFAGGGTAKRRFAIWQLVFYRNRCTG